MKARLISYSQTPEGELYVGNDVQELVAYCARVSNPQNQINSETSERLLAYLAKHKHWSPFEMVSACLEIETTRDIRLQDTKNRQNSIETDSVELQREWDRHQRRVLWMVKDVYKWAIKNGIAKEQARAVLPEGCNWRICK